MRLLIRRQTCLRRIWKQSDGKDVLFRVRDSTGLQERKQSLSSLSVTILHQQKQHDNSPGDCSTVSNSTTKDSPDGLDGEDQFTSGNDALTNLYQLMKHFVQQNCVPSYISQFRSQKCDSSSSYTSSQLVKESYDKQNLMLNYMAPAGSQFFEGLETLPEFPVSLDMFPQYNVCGSYQNTPLCGQLLKSHVQHQLSSYFISQRGNGIKVKNPVQSCHVRHYSISKHSNRCSQYSDDRTGRLLSVQYLISTPSVHHLFSSLVIYKNSWHHGMRQTHILSLEPLKACGLMRRWISKKEYNFPELKEDDLVESFMRGGGAGGQAVAKTNNCVVLLHKPTGIQLKVHVSRSLEQNRKKAREMMIEKLDLHFNGENSFAEQKKAEKKKAKQKMKKKAGLVREKMKAFKEGLKKDENGPDEN
ncbi:uncharacterized protein LOC110445856 isoform X1 [Mizuhopecten yessoensis]|uniref:uncharacterized protein LOC110445856 isoform X1 n=1 Tax=Mizuhopecten yessoensis TaxID=6573 RepID=UPI000B45DF37|nr:uncharacterized protein LOC110445856 isoform X1 [Mizuhopecten yessoensis]